MRQIPRSSMKGAKPHRPGGSDELEERPRGDGRGDGEQRDKAEPPRLVGHAGNEERPEDAGDLRAGLQDPHLGGGEPARLQEELEIGESDRRCREEEEVVEDERDHVRRHSPIRRGVP